MNLIFLIIIILFIVPFAYAGMQFAPWLPTHTSDLKRILTHIPETMNGKWIELGAGTAHVSRYIAKNRPSLKVHTIESNLWIYILTYINNKISPLPNLYLHFGNLYNYPIEKYDIVYLFGTPKFNQRKISPFLEKAIQKKTRIISYAFPLTIHTLPRIDKQNQNTIPIFIYDVIGNNASSTKH